MSGRPHKLFENTDPDPGSDPGSKKLGSERPFENTVPDSQPTKTRLVENRRNLVRVKFHEENQRLKNSLLSPHAT